LGDADIPDSVKPSLSPESTPVGEIFRYTLEGDLPVDELRLIEDWTLEREFKSIPGVADVVSFGGPTRTIDVKLDLSLMKALGLKVSDVAQSLGQNHANAGGSVITHGSESYIVRSLGLYERPEDLELAVISTQKNVPVHVRDIGRVEMGHKPRLGQVGKNENDDTVEGIILLRQGSDTLKTCEEIKKRIERLNSSVLPKGAHIVPYYDRTELIRRSSHTVFHNILFGVFLVCAILILGFGIEQWALCLAVALIIPFALLVAFVGVSWSGYTPNLISLGAVDFGIIVETAIFAAEALIAAIALKGKNTSETIVESLSEVFGPALLCAGLLLVAFVPILSLQRIEGRIFRPLGITLVSAVIGGQLGALILIPAFGLLAPSLSRKDSKIEHFIHSVLEKFKKLSRKIYLKIDRPVLVFGIIFAIALALTGLGLGREFLPNLNEGALYIRATAPPTISREASAELANRIRMKLKEIPEVEEVITQNGRPDDGTDVNGFDNIEAFVVLKPPEEWKSSSTLDGLTAIAQKKLDPIEGVEFNYSQPIKDNVDEAISGVKGELVVKVFGPKLEELQGYANEIEKVLKSIRGADDVGAEQLLGQPELRFNMNRDLLSRYGLRVTDAEDVLETALLGKTSAKLIDEQGRAVEIVVKPDLPPQPSLDLLLSLPIITADGAKIPLGDVSNAGLTEGVSRVYREQGERRIAVKCSVRERAVVDFVNEANQKIREKVKLGPRYQMVWSGSFENAARAAGQFMLVVPLCMLAMLVILYTWFGSWQTVGFLLWEIPFAGVGGLLALRLFGLNLSISAAAGGIVLIGVSFLTGMMLISEWLRTGSSWKALEEKGKSILLSSGVAIVGLVPAAFSHGIGSETAKPFAVMILGGLTSALIFTLLLMPVLLERAKIDPKGRG
jgi:cobalt-zinc-cadmium resistance protein CzcA